MGQQEVHSQTSQFSIYGVQAGISEEPHSSEVQSQSVAEPSALLTKILIVDDEQLIANTLSHILNKSGFAAKAVYSGDAALAIVPELCPDIVLTDVRMPGRNGIETGILIRRQRPQTRVILFSGQSGVGDMIQDAMCEGYCFELWPKPIHPKELVRRLRELPAS